MITLKQIFFISSILIINIFSISLEAAQVTTEYFSADNIPKEYGKEHDGQDWTIVTLQDGPKNSTISVIEKRLLMSKEKAKQSEVQLGENGELKLIVQSKGFVPGVPLTVSFLNKSFKKEVTFIPYRLFAKSSIDNAVIEAELTIVSPVTYTIFFEGFDKDEDLQFKSVSYDEKIDLKLNSKYKAFSFMPAATNKRGGIARLSFTRASGEVLRLELPWGLEWMKYQFYVDKNGEEKCVLDDTKDTKIIQYFKTKR